MTSHAFVNNWVGFLMAVPTVDISGGEHISLESFHCPTLQSTPHSMDSLFRAPFTLDLYVDCLVPALASTMSSSAMSRAEHILPTFVVHLCHSRA